jgi:hypothetical protein
MTGSGIANTWGWLVPACLLGACSGAEPSGDLESPAAGESAAWFVDVTTSSGVDFVHQMGATEQRHLPETMGGGGALLDADGDGHLDLYLVQSGLLPAPGSTPVDAALRQGPPPVNRLYLGDGDGTFADATARSGDAADPGYGQGCAAGDIDGDGDVDLYVTNFGPDLLLANRGDAHFDERSAEAGVRDERWTAGATFFDADRDGDLDLYVTGYVLVDVARPEWCGRQEAGWRSYCHPDRYPGLTDRLWINDGRGAFREESVARGMGDTGGKGLGAIPIDFDLDGDLDLYVANDSVENRLWRNADGRFEDATLLSGTGVNAGGMTEAGMGLACGDLDGDGDLDLYVTNFDNESNTLYRNDGEWFTDATVKAGLEAPSRLPVGFGVVAEDFDLDGDLDLAVANGHIIHNIELYHDGKRWRQPPQLYVNRGAGRFEERARLGGGLTATPRVGRALLSGDIDEDGDADLVLVECGGPARVLRNDAPSGERGSFTIRGAAPHAALIATFDDGTRQLVQAGPAPSYFGACAAEARVALGPGRRVVRVETVGPGGAPIDLTAAVERGSGRWWLDLSND